MADMAIEIQHERIRAAEALAARDVTIQRLSDAYVSLLQKSELIERYECEWKRQNPGATTPTERAAVEYSVMAEHARDLQNTIVDMSHEMERLKATVSSPLQTIDASPNYEETPAKVYRRAAPITYIYALTTTGNNV
ncbi:hypothetical protein BDQ12DRAFT_688247 [Crucibulum laeve]|uniref:Uncharacterized protein n=1 Tax=Crucibulum laeve TaxID=68775 RepID=A0A5C3LRS8_9AGAR|nr:hypothetical protein BDQ12DRAFT_688247 [Crucibulum laeve]